MGLVSLEITIGAAGGTSTQTRPLDPGILSAVSVNGTLLYIPKGQTYAQVTLRRGGSDEAWAGVTLINDYVYHNYYPTWSGIIYLEASDILHFSLTSSAMDRVFLAALTTRYQQITLGGQVVDLRPTIISST
jgi:hypothetical protein